MDIGMPCPDDDLSKEQEEVDFFWQANAASPESLNPIPSKHVFSASLRHLDFNLTRCASKQD